MMNQTSINFKNFEELTLLKNTLRKKRKKCLTIMNNQNVVTI